MTHLRFRSARSAQCAWFSARFSHRNRMWKIKMVGGVEKNIEFLLPELDMLKTKCIT